MVASLTEHSQQAPVWLTGRVEMAVLGAGWRCRLQGLPATACVIVKKNQLVLRKPRA
eukprot:SAG22_NODE_6659_length_826_cov_0.792297_3_plen_56_part_01